MSWFLKTVWNGMINWNWRTPKHKVDSPIAWENEDCNEKEINIS